MTRHEALAAIIAAGIPANLTPADDEQTDDQFSLHGNEAVAVQISATRDGLSFCAAVSSGEGRDFGIAFGRDTPDPVFAARQAMEYAVRDGVVTLN